MTETLVERLKEAEAQIRAFNENVSAVMVEDMKPATVVVEREGPDIAALLREAADALEAMGRQIEVDNGWLTDGQPMSPHQAMHERIGELSSLRAEVLEEAAQAADEYCRTDPFHDDVGGAIRALKDKGLSHPQGTED